MGAAAIPLIVSAVGEGLQYSSQQDQQRQQDNTAAQGIMRQGQLNNQANADVSSLTKSIAASNPSAAIDAQKAQYMKALQSVAPSQLSANPVVPGASKKYGAAVTNADQNVNSYGTQQAGIMANVDAPTLQRLGEQEQIGSTAGDLGLLQNQSVGQAGTTKLGIGSINANPWLAAIGQMTTGYGTGMGKKTAPGSAYSGDPTQYSNGPEPVQDPSIVGGP